MKFNLKSILNPTICLLLCGVFLHFPHGAFAQDQGDEDAEKLQKEFESGKYEEITDDSVIDDQSILENKVRQKERKRQLRLKKLRERAEAKSQAKEEAIRERTDRYFYAGLGAIAPFLGKTSKDKKGTRSLMPPSVLIDIGFSFRFHAFGPDYYFLPKLTYTPLGLSDYDGGATSRILTLSGLLSKELLWNGRFGLEPKFGPGFLFYSVSGAGGTLDLNNGNGTTTFYAPGLSSTATMVYLDLGVGMYFGKTKNFRVDLDSVVIGLLSSRRTFSLSALFQMGIF